jgi:hypothetical protein
MMGKKENHALPTIGEKNKELVSLKSRKHSAKPRRMKRMMA